MRNRTVCWIGGVAAALLIGCMIGCGKSVSPPPAGPPGQTPPAEAPPPSPAQTPAPSRAGKFKLWADQIAETQIRAREAARAARVAAWIGERTAAVAGGGFRSLAYLKNLAGNFAGDLREIRGGIADAVAAGDPALAAEVQQSGLKLLRARAANELGKMWAGLNWWSATIWDRMVWATAVAVIELNAAEEKVEIKAWARRNH